MLAVIAVLVNTAWLRFHESAMLEEKVEVGALQNRLAAAAKAYQKAHGQAPKTLSSFVNANVLEAANGCELEPAQGEGAQERLVCESAWQYWQPVVYTWDKGNVRMDTSQGSL